MDSSVSPFSFQATGQEVQVPARLAHALSLEFPLLLVEFTAVLLFLALNANIHRGHGECEPPSRVISSTALCL